MVTADDFGLAEEVNEAVEYAHRTGVLSAASLMVAGPAARHAVHLARRLPGLRVGLHLVLVDGAPALPREEVTELIDAAGALRGDLLSTALRLALSPLARRQMAQEIAAQLAAFRDTGLTLDHINAHRHFHVHPVVAADFIRQAAQDGAKAVRVPFEPIEPLRRVEPTSLTWQQRVTAPWAGRLRERARRVGLQVPTATFGVRWSGQMTAKRLTGLLRHLPDGLNEIYLHPATSNTFAGCTPGCHYSQEFAALVDREVIETVRRSGSAVGGYQDFLPV